MVYSFLGDPGGVKIGTEGTLMGVCLRRRKELAGFEELAYMKTFTSHFVGSQSNEEEKYD